MQTIQYYDISTYVLSFLCDRKWTVVINVAWSSWCPTRFSPCV